MTKTTRAIMLPGIIWILGFALVGCVGQSEDTGEPVDSTTSAEPAEDTDSGGGFFDFLEAETYEIPAGTPLTFELAETLSTVTNESGDPFSATLLEPVVVDGKTLLPAGAVATGRIAEAVESGRVEGRASIRLVMSQVSHDGETYPIATDAFYAVADATKGEDAVKIGAGAGIGAAIGGILGGGQGAATGAAIGGGGGTAVVLATKGEDIELPSGTRITFVLSEPVEVTL